MRAGKAYKSHLVLIGIRRKKKRDMRKPKLMRRKERDLGEKGPGAAITVEVEDVLR